MIKRNIPPFSKAVGIYPILLSHEIISVNNYFKNNGFTLWSVSDDGECIYTNSDSRNIYSELKHIIKRIFRKQKESAFMNGMKNGSGLYTPHRLDGDFIMFSQGDLILTEVTNSNIDIKVSNIESLYIETDYINNKITYDGCYECNPYFIPVNAHLKERINEWLTNGDMNGVFDVCTDEYFSKNGKPYKTKINSSLKFIEKETKQIYKELTKELPNWNIELKIHTTDNIYKIVEDVSNSINGK